MRKREIKAIFDANPTLWVFASFSAFGESCVLSKPCSRSRILRYSKGVTRIVVTSTSLYVCYGDIPENITPWAVQDRKPEVTNA